MTYVTSHNETTQAYFDKLIATIDCRKYFED